MEKRVVDMVCRSNILHSGQRNYMSLILCMLLNAMILYFYICKNVMDTILLPIIRNKKGNISSKDIYHPITSVI